MAWCFSGNCMFGSHARRIEEVNMHIHIYTPNNCLNGIQFAVCVFVPLKQLSRTSNIIYTQWTCAAKHCALLVVMHIPANVIAPRKKKTGIYVNGCIVCMYGDHFRSHVCVYFFFFYKYSVCGHIYSLRTKLHINLACQTRLSNLHDSNRIYALDSHTSYVSLSYMFVYFTCLLASLKKRI